MKNLEEKKLLLKMMRAFGQDDKELAESIRREEELTEKLFGGKKVEPPVIVEETKPEPVVLKEADPPPPPAPAFTPPTTNTVIDVINVLKTANANANTNIYRDKELEGMRRTIAEMMQKISTLSWGGGGTGIVRLYDADDFGRNTIEDNKQFVTWRNGWFQMDYINPNEIVANTVFVNSNSYQITNDDYYIGVNVASTVTITLPPSDEVYTGREFYVKDESGNAGAPARFIDIYPSGSDKIDNQNYVRLQIDNGGLKFIYRDGWRVI
jgi:hypothetical protein